MPSTVERDKPAKGQSTPAPTDDDLVDEASEESFPASDPPARGGSTGAGAPDRKPAKG